ncbi:MAG: beta-N-acetylhexosaminidase [Desulfobaccales bacterium]
MGPLFMAGIPGPEVDSETRKLVRELQVGGIILFARNLEDPEQVWHLTREVQDEARAVGNPPLLIAVDQEGGPVQRLKEPFTLIPPAQALGRDSTPAQVEALARTVARELTRVGINLNLAPVLDVARGPDCPLWERSFGPDPVRVAAFGEAAVRGYLGGGVVPVAKHFPGLGDTSLDSHQVLPTAQNPDPDRRRDLYPFQRAIAAGVPAIMTAHLHVPAWDEHPATLSPVALQEWLRGRLGFDGVIITDDLEMGAITGAAAAPQAVCQALAAGADLLLICSPSAAVWEAAALLGRQQALKPRLFASARRLQRLRERLPRQPASLAEVRSWLGLSG